MVMQYKYFNSGNHYWLHPYRCYWMVNETDRDLRSKSFQVLCKMHGKGIASGDWKSISSYAKAKNKNIFYTFHREPSHTISNSSCLLLISTMKVWRLGWPCFHTTMPLNDWCSATVSCLASLISLMLFVPSSTTCIIKPKVRCYLYEVHLR